MVLVISQISHNLSVSLNITNTAKSLKLRQCFTSCCVDVEAQVSRSEKKQFGIPHSFFPMTYHSFLFYRAVRNRYRWEQAQQHRLYKAQCLLHRLYLWALFRHSGNYSQYKLEIASSDHNERQWDT